MFSSTLNPNSRTGRPDIGKKEGVSINTEGYTPGFRQQNNHERVGTNAGDWISGGKDIFAQRNIRYEIIK